MAANLQTVTSKTSDFNWYNYYLWGTLKDRDFFARNERQYLKRKYLYFKTRGPSCVSQYFQCLGTSGTHKFLADADSFMW
jgi:hypothetical protein